MRNKSSLWVCVKLMDYSRRFQQNGYIHQRSQSSQHKFAHEVINYLENNNFSCNFVLETWNFLDSWWTKRCEGLRRILEILGNLSHWNIHREMSCDEKQENCRSNGAPTRQQLRAYEWKEELHENLATCYERETVSRYVCDEETGKTKRKRKYKARIGGWPRRGRRERRVNERCGGGKDGTHDGNGSRLCWET